MTKSRNIIICRVLPIIDIYNFNANLKMPFFQDARKYIVY